MVVGVARDISLIILIVPTCLCALLPAAMAFGAWYVTRRAHLALRPRLRSARTAVRRSRDAIDRGTELATRPIYFYETQAARWKAMWRALVSPHGLQGRTDNG